MGERACSDRVSAVQAGTDIAWLRSRLEELERIDRPSASPGEREAAEWLAGQFAELGLEARIEAERAHGTYWWPIGIGAFMGLIASLLVLLRGCRASRLIATLLGAAGASGIASDFPPNGRWLRRFLPQGTTYNVVCELGPADADRTVVLIAVAVLFSVSYWLISKVEAAKWQKFGRLRKQHDAWASALRATHGTEVVQFLASIGSRFSVKLSQKAAAQAVPVVGAVSGATLNTLFMRHFQRMAEGHFTVRALERSHGAIAVRKAYDGLAGTS